MRTQGTRPGGGATPAPPRLAPRSRRFPRPTPVVPADPSRGRGMAGRQPAHGALLGRRSLSGAVVGGAPVAPAAPGRSGDTCAGVDRLDPARRHAAQPGRSHLYGVRVGLLVASGGAGTRLPRSLRPRVHSGRGGVSPREAAGRDAPTGWPRWRSVGARAASCPQLPRSRRTRFVALARSAVGGHGPGRGQRPRGGGRVSARRLRRWACPFYNKWDGQAAE